MLRVVLDTNIYVSGLIFPKGNPRERILFDKSDCPAKKRRLHVGQSRRRQRSPADRHPRTTCKNAFAAWLNTRRVGNTSRICRST